LRLRIPILSYLAAALTGSVVAGIAAMGMAGVYGQLATFLLGVMFVFLFGGVLALPVAVPTIVVTERMGKGPWWVFLLAGIGTGIALFTIWVGLTSADGYSEVLWLLMPATISAAMTYWFIAWQRNPPVLDIEPTVEVFE